MYLATSKFNCCAIQQFWKLFCTTAATAFTKALLHLLYLNWDTEHFGSPMHLHIQGAVGKQFSISRIHRADLTQRSGQHFELQTAATGNHPGRYPHICGARLTSPCPWRHVPQISSNSMSCCFSCYGRSQRPSLLQFLWEINTFSFTVRTGILKLIFQPTYTQTPSQACLFISNFSNTD